MPDWTPQILARPTRAPSHLGWLRVGVSAAQRCLCGAFATRLRAYARSRAMASFAGGPDPMALGPVYVPPIDWSDVTPAEGFGFWVSWGDRPRSTLQFCFLRFCFPRSHFGYSKPNRRLGLCVLLVRCL